MEHVSAMEAVLGLVVEAAEKLARLRPPFARPVKQVASQLLTVYAALVEVAWWWWYWVATSACSEKDRAKLAV